MTPTRIYTIKFTVLILGIIYASYIILMYPYVGATATKVDGNKCKVDYVSDFGWANFNEIRVGDILICDNESKLIIKIEKQSTLTKFTGHTVEIVNVDYSTLPAGILLYQLLPILYFVAILLIVIFLQRNTQHHLFTNRISNFVLLIAIAYLSSWVSARNDMLGAIICSSAILWAPIQLIIYLNQFKEQTKRITCLKQYILYLIMVIISVIDYFLFEWNVTFIPIIIIVMSLSILGLCIYILRNYSQFMNLIRSTRMKYFLWIVSIIFIPVILFFILPKLIFGSTIISEEILVLFPLAISFVFLYISYAKVFFDVEYIIVLLFKYLLFSIIFGGSIVFLVKESKLDTAFQICLTIIIMILSLLSQHYLLPLNKSKRYYKLNSSVLPQAIMQIKSSDELLTLLKQEIIRTLDVKSCSLFVLKQKKHIESIDDLVTEEEQQDLLDLLAQKEVKNGELFLSPNGYILVIMNGISCYILKMSHKKSMVKLSKEEKNWLNNVALLSSLTLDSFEKAHELLNFIQERRDLSSSITATRVLTLIGERERNRIAENIHDSILHDSISLKKMVESYALTKSEQKLEEIKQQLNKHIDHINDICFDLNPPFSNNHGLIENLHHLIQKHEESCNIHFYLDCSSELAQARLQKEWMIHVYYIVNELINNARKYSSAKIAYISIRNDNKVLTLLYEDDDLEINFNAFEKSGLGLYQVKEYVRRINGEISWSSSETSGLKVKITIKEIDLEQ